MSATTYLIFGDLHGRVLPAFRLAQAWSREHGVSVAGILQVGDLGYFPDLSRLDKATKRHADRDPTELGVRLLTEESAEADDVFHGDEPAPQALWFTAGNHEDHEILRRLERAAGPRAGSFPVDAYLRLRCLRDGAVETLPGGLRVGALWGIDHAAPNARRRIPEDARIRERSAIRLACAEFDVLLTHDGPRDAVFDGAGSAEIDGVLRSVRPALAFFGHYGGGAARIDREYGATQVYRLGDFDLRHRGGCAELGSVGALMWDGSAGEFRYLEQAWLSTFTRHNWRHR